MLNLSDNSVDQSKLKHFKTFKHTFDRQSRKRTTTVIIIVFALLIGILFLPWTQNVRGKGKLTTLRPEDRPQGVYATISGRVEKWYVREGDIVKAGDTLAFLSEVKTDYFDPQLLDRTQLQVDAKNFSVKSYEEKAQALEQQVAALRETRDLKMEEARNKIQQARLSLQSDSMNLSASVVAYDIAKKQADRIDSLYQKGIKSLTDLENYRNKEQEKLAKRIESENKYLTSQNKLINAQIYFNNITNEYAEKIAKSQSDRFSTLSALYDASSQVAKLESQYSSYEVRSNFYYITAPQSGFVTEILSMGLGEIVKENDAIMKIVPRNIDLAVEMYVSAIDYPLLQEGQNVRFIFDGWPAFVFSGWPNMSFGTFGGKIVMLDNMANKKGKYRILVQPDETDKKWPEALRIGSAADGIIMLNDVPVWYELWRQLNGFPPDYYEETEESEDKLKLKAPMNQLKK